MKDSLRFRPEVPDDIADACRWYESRRVGLGERFIRELESTLQRIADTPRAYAMGEREVRSARIHSFPYVVHFRLERDTIIVLAVMYGGRDPAAWQGRA